MTQPKNINLYFRILKPPKLVENIMDLKDFDRIVISITEENSKLDMELEIPLNKEEIRANDDLSDLSAEIALNHQLQRAILTSHIFGGNMSKSCFLILNLHSNFENMGQKGRYLDPSTKRSRNK